jgi:hypothetical protein
MSVEIAPSAQQMLLYLVLPPLVLGLVLAKLAYLPRRRGDTPHCRKCNYTLTGLSSERCPECGQALNEDTIVHGERKRRPILGGVACLLLLLAVANTAILLAGDRIDWYRFRPTSWVIEDAASATPAVATRAWTELQRRMKDGSLSEVEHGKLTEVALAEQAKPADGPIGRALLDYLGTRAAAGKLPEAQKERFVDQGVRFALTVRPRIAKGDPVYYRVAHTGRGPTSQAWWTSSKVREMRINGKAVNPGGYGSSGSSFGGGGATATSVRFAEPGQHVLELDIEYAVRHGPMGDPKKSTHFLTRTVTRATPFEILAEAPADLVKMVPSDAGRAELLANIRGRKAILQAGSDYLHLNLDVSPLTVNIAFDVFGRIGDQEFPLGTMTLPKNTQMGFGMGADQIVKKFGRPKSLTIILRSSDKVARRSIEIYDAWQGELVFEDVPVSEKW